MRLSMCYEAEMEAQEDVIQQESHRRTAAPLLVWDGFPFSPSRDVTYLRADASPGDGCAPPTHLLLPRIGTTPVHCPWPATNFLCDLR